MSNRQKQQGTRLETSIVKRLNTGLRHGAARRLAEGGTNDEGDVELELPHGHRLIIEAKHRQALPVHAALEKAMIKAGSTPAVVWWKRTMRKEGGTRRSKVGVGEVVVMDVDTFLWLLEGRNGLL